jgi:hypothetical protein
MKFAGVKRIMQVYVVDCGLAYKSLSMANAHTCELCTEARGRTGTHPLAITNSHQQPDDDLSPVTFSKHEMNREIFVQCDKCGLYRRGLLCVCEQKTESQTAAEALRIVKRNCGL